MSKELTFDDYLDKHQAPWCEVQLRKGVIVVKKSIHYAVVNMLELIQLPRMVLNASDFALAFFALFPSLESTIKTTKEIIKTIKDFTRLVKGTRSINGFLHFRFSWKFIVLNGSSFVLFVISCLTIAEKFKLLDLTVMHVALAQIPLLGALPFAGVLNLAMIGLSGMLFLISSDNRRKIDQEIAKIVRTKIDFWQKPLDLKKIRSRRSKYGEKITSIKRELESKQKLLQEGSKRQVSLLNPNPTTLQAYKKAQNELLQIINNLTSTLATITKKKEQWDYLKKHLKEIPTAELSIYRGAKLGKWKIKQHKLELEKKSCKITNMSSLFMFVSQIFHVSPTLIGLPLIIKDIAVKILGTYRFIFGIANYSTKKAIRKIKTAPVKMELFITNLS